nr:ATP-binding protein [Oleiagrimonas soli]
MIGVSIILLLGVAAIAMDQLVDAEMQQRFDASLLSQAQAVSALVEVGPNGLDMDELQREPSHLLLGNARTTYVVQCSNGQRFSSPTAAERYPFDWRNTPDDKPHFTDIDAGGVQQRAVWFGFRPAPAEHAAVAGRPMDIPDCRMLLLLPRTQLDRILFAIDGILLITPMLALIAVLLLSPWLVRRGLQPLSALAEHMRDVGPHAPGQRLPPTRTRELTPLTQRFNEVLTRMDDSMQRERRFASALAHETRTRLAELRTLVDVERSYPSGRPLADLLADVGVIGSELENTVSSLLLLTRLEAGLEKLECERVDIEALVSKQLAGLDDVLTRRHVRIERTTTLPVFLRSDASLLRIIVGNLLRNAAVYAPEGATVELAWDADGLRVINPAPELDADEVAHLGRRHWRKHSADNEGHAGLGLNLAMAAARALDVQLSFVLDDDQRLRADLRWAAAVIGSDARSRR